MREFRRAFREAQSRIPPTCSHGTRSYLPHTINSSEGGYFAARNATRTIERLRRDDCVANLLAYKDATTRWAADTSAAPDAVPTLADLMPYIRYERLCPTGGVYTLAPPGTDPGCSAASRCSRTCWGTPMRTVLAPAKE